MRSTYYPGVFTKPGAYYPGVCTKPGTYYSGVCTKPGTYYPGVLYVLYVYVGNRSPDLYFLPEGLEPVHI